MTLSGCGSFGRADDAAGPAPRGDASYGSPPLDTVDQPPSGSGETSATATSAPPTADAGSPSTSSTTSGTTVANRTVRDDESGLRLTLVVADRLEFGPDDDVTMQLVFENTTSSVVHHDSNQDLRFGLVDDAGAAVWTDTSCRLRGPDDEPPTGALALDPGERGEFVGRYPTDRSADSTTAGPAADDCRVSPGSYRVVAQVDWCPDAAIVRSDINDAAYCDPEKVVPVAAAPLRVTITG